MVTYSNYHYYYRDCMILKRLRDTEKFIQNINKFKVKSMNSNN